MKKIHFTFVILLSLSGINSAMAKPWQEIKESKELRVGVPGDYAPLAFHNRQNKLIGFDIDMAYSLGKALHLNILFVPSSWPTLSTDLAADKFDIAMGGITETPGRRKQFALSSPVFKNGKIALTQCNRINDFKSLEDIDRKGVRIVVNPGGTNLDYVDKHIRYADVIREKIMMPLCRRFVNAALMSCLPTCSKVLITRTKSRASSAYQPGVSSPTLPVIKSI